MIAACSAEEQRTTWHSCPLLATKGLEDNIVLTLHLLSTICLHLFLAGPL